MKKGLLLCSLFLISISVFGQQFSQYNTGSLYESFENPSVRTFIPDTTKQFAFNFFLPNFDANAFLTGNAQTALKSRLFSSYYNTADLKIGRGYYNHLNANANAYSVMFKMFYSADGNQELGFFINSKAELRGIATDETIALLNGYLNFPATAYNNVFDDNVSFQAYHQIGVTYREQVTKRFSIGFKFSALSGLYYRKYNITNSSVVFDKTNDRATLALAGTTNANGDAGQTGASKILPTFLNPGAAISFGTSYLDYHGFTWQANIKDLGFIHWNSTSANGVFSGSALVTGISTADREKHFKTAADSLTKGNVTKGGFISKTNGLLELAINKSYWFGSDEGIKFSPTLIASKELFYPGFTAALVTPVQVGHCIFSLTTSYNDLLLLNLGGQFMIKKDNSEFFIGTERLYQTGSFLKSAFNSSSSSTQPQYTTADRSFSGLDFYVGVSFKFGPLIESRMNESSIPMGDKGFFGRLWEKWFHKDKNY